MPKISAAFTLALCAGCCFSVEAQVHAETDRLGDSLRVALPVGAAILSVAHEDTGGLKELGATLILSQSSTEVLKRAVDSPRPDGSGQGFPSGHTSMAFASAGYVRQRYGWQESVPFYALASVTAWSRVHTNHHFTKDVLGGAVVGEASARLVAGWMGPRQTASVSYGADGVRVSYAKVF